MKIDFYYTVTSPPCRSVILLGKTLGLEFSMKKVSTWDNETKTPEFLKLNPQHCVPTLVDNGFVIWESRAVLAYLVNKYAKDDSLYPKDPQKRAVVDQRLHFDLGTVFPRLKEYAMPLMSGKIPSEESIKNLEDVFIILDKFLEGQEWVAGKNITIADYALIISVSFVDLFNYDISKYQNITKWVSRVSKKIPGFDEVQEAANVELKKRFAMPPPK